MFTKHTVIFGLMASAFADAPVITQGMPLPPQTRPATTASVPLRPVTAVPKPVTTLAPLAESKLAARPVGTPRASGQGVDAMARYPTPKLTQMAAMAAPKGGVINLHSKPARHVKPQPPGTIKPSDPAPEILGGGPTPELRLSTPFRDPRLVSYPFNANTVYEVVARGGFNTQLMFAPGEKVRSVYFSDACVTIEKGDGQDRDAEDACDSGWHVRLSDTRDRLFVKPTSDGLENEATIITNRRTYEVSFTSTAKRQWFKRVSWQTRDAMALEIQDASSARPQKVAQRMGEDFAEMDTRPARTASQAQGALEPEDEDALRKPTRSALVDVARMHTDYRIVGDAEFKPELVFDDGQSTRIKLPADLSEKPVLLALDSQGQAEVLWYTEEGPYLRFEGTRKVVVLKLGKDVVQLHRKPEGHAMHRRNS